jgi:hypothetical protein
MKNDKKALESIGIALGLRGPSQKQQCEKAAKRNERLVTTTHTLRLFANCSKARCVIAVE